MRAGVSEYAGRLWLALRHGSVTISDTKKLSHYLLWLALRHGSVTMVTCSDARPFCCGLLSGTDQLQFLSIKILRFLVVACSQARISYNTYAGLVIKFSLWLALRHGSVTIASAPCRQSRCCGLLSGTDQLQYQALRRGMRCGCGLLSGTDQLQSVRSPDFLLYRCGLLSGTDQLQLGFVYS